MGVRQTQDRIKIMHSILPSPGEIDEAAKVTWKDNGYDPPLSADIDGISSSQPGPQAKMHKNHKNMDNTTGQSEQELKLPARFEGGSEKPSVG